MKLSSSGWCASALFLVLGAASCRSILGITPGHEADEAGGSNTGGLPGSGGEPATNGGDSPAVGGRVNSGGKGGVESGGKSGVAGTSNAQAGEGGAPPVSLFPDATCAACIERNCATEAAACTDAACTSGIASWLACSAPAPDQCTTSEAGPLLDLETCGQQSCDLCQHTTDNSPTVEILAPSNGASVPVDGTGLLEVSVRVHHLTVKAVGACGADTNCGHIHLNLDGVNCHVTPFYNQIITEVAADGTADSSVKTLVCMNPVAGRTVALTASLSSNASHADRVPMVQSTVNVTVQP